MLADKADRQIGALVFGTSFGVLTHVRALRDAGIAVLGLVGRNERKTAERARFFDIPHAFTDIDEALACPGAELVAVATPPATHAPITIAAVGAGKHVLCEKPFALHLGQAREMLAAAERAGVVHAIGVENRFKTQQETLRRAIASGVIGQPRTALFALDMPSLVDPSVELPAWWESEAEGGGWLGAHASHPIDQIRSTLGEFDAVSGVLHTLAPRPAMTADDTYTVQFRLVNGCTGVMHSSATSGGPSLSTTKITGTRGTAWLQPGEVKGTVEVWTETAAGRERVPDVAGLPQVEAIPPPTELFPAHAAKTRWHVSGSDLAPFTRIYARVRDKVIGKPVADEPPLATFADGVGQQAVLDAIRRSAAVGNWVTCG